MINENRVTKKLKPVSLMLNRKTMVRIQVRALEAKSKKNASAMKRTKIISVKKSEVGI